MLRGDISADLILSAESSAGAFGFCERSADLYLSGHGFPSPMLWEYVDVSEYDNHDEILEADEVDKDNVGNWSHVGSWGGGWRQHNVGSWGQFW